MSALQVGQGLTTLRTRIVRPACAALSSSSPRPCRSKRLSPLNLVALHHDHLEWCAPCVVPCSSSDAE